MPGVLVLVCVAVGVLVITAAVVDVRVAVLVAVRVGVLVGVLVGVAVAGVSSMPEVCVGVGVFWLSPGLRVGSGALVLELPEVLVGVAVAVTAAVPRGVAVTVASVGGLVG